MSVCRNRWALVLAVGALAASVAGAQESRPAGVAAMGRPDPDMQSVLDAHAAMKPKPIELLTPGDARKQPTLAAAATEVARQRGMSTKPDEVGDVDNRTVEWDGNKVKVRVYTPKGEGPFPVVLYFHGGGFVIADLDTYDATPRALVIGATAVVVSVDYRQAPEHKWPAAHDDAYRATQWVLANAAQIKGDAARVAVAGESAGGNLATAVCLMAKDRGGKMPIYQVLVYPVTSGVTNLPSYLENADAKPLNRAMMGWFLGHYTTQPGDADNIYLSPLKATEAQLVGLPPATVITAQIDPLRSDGELYARKLKAAGVDVSYRNYDGVTHEFFGMAKVVSKAKDAQAFVLADLNRAFGGQAQLAGDRTAPK